MRYKKNPKGVSKGASRMAALAAFVPSGSAASIAQQGGRRKTCREVKIDLLKLASFQGGTLETTLQDLARTLNSSPQTIRKAVKELHASGEVRAMIRRKAGIYMKVNENKRLVENNDKTRDSKEKTNSNGRVKKIDLDLKGLNLDKLSLHLGRRESQAPRHDAMLIKNLAIKAEAASGRLFFYGTTFDKDRRAVRWAVFCMKLNKGRTLLSCAIADYYRSRSSKYHIRHKPAWLVTVSTADLKINRDMVQFVLAWIDYHKKVAMTHAVWAMGEKEIGTQQVKQTSSTNYESTRPALDLNSLCTWPDSCKSPPLPNVEDETVRSFLILVRQFLSGTEKFPQRPVQETQISPHDDRFSWGYRPASCLSCRGTLWIKEGIYTLNDHLKLCAKFTVASRTA